MINGFYVSAHPFDDGSNMLNALLSADASSCSSRQMQILRHVQRPSAGILSIFCLEANNQRRRYRGSMKYGAWARFFSDVSRIGCAI